jgi:hypothetical protein
VLKEVYKHNYHAVVDEIKAQLGELTNMDEIKDFFEILEND